MDQHAKRAQIREELLSKFIVQARGKADSPNHWHWAKDAVFPLSRDNEVREQWPALSTIKGNGGSETKDCDNPASKDHESSTSKDRVSSKKNKVNGVEAKCKEWSRVASTPAKDVAKPKVTDPTNLKHQMIHVHAS